MGAKMMAKALTTRSKLNVFMFAQTQRDRNLQEEKKPTKIR